MITCLDIENTFSKKDSTPYSGNNQLVSVGYKTSIGNENYLCFYHSEKQPTPNNFSLLQSVLHSTTLLVGHNIKYDLQWLLHCGFTYDGKVWDTMGIEYLLARGMNREISLDASCKRRAVQQKKTGLINNWEVGPDEMSWTILEEYGKQDVDSTYDLAMVQAELLDIDLKEWATQ
jgi:DNA polymerase I-like protein with 3'-5' exonuclease and polymerase domains